MATTYLESDFSGTGATGATIATYSMWVKLELTDNRATIISGKDNGNYLKIRFADDGSGHYFALYGASMDMKSTRIFRDPSAWYHVVMAFNTGLAASDDRIKVWINNEQITDWSTNTRLGQNDPLYLTKSDNLQIGAYNNTEHIDGCMAHVHCCDGTAYTPANFGETDSTSGIWIPISAPSVTYGTKGYFLKFAAGAFGTDSSGNSNDFTVTGAGITTTKDNPRNNYCTWNSVGNSRISGGTAYPVTFSNGNTTALNAHATYHTGTMGTMGVKKGKWYYECKCSDVGGIDYIGYAGEDDWGNLLNTYTYANDGTIDDVAYGNTYTSGDIISVAFDADNGTIWFGKNGVWQNSASEAEIEAGTDTNAAVTSMDMTKYYLLAQKGFQDATNQLNTGNGYFGTTAITSAGTNAGEGLFEYDVPSGYYAFNTNNLATYG